MWFNNINVYQLHNNEALDSIALNDMLAGDAAKPLGSADASRYGWTPPAGRASQVYLHESQGHRLISMLKQERILPGSVVKEALEEKVEEIETREGRKVTRGEKTAFKEQITEELLPRAFVKSTKIDAWWDIQRNRIIINSASRTRCEELLDLLRQTLGTLKVTPLTTQTLPIRAMTDWLGDASTRPANLALRDKATLKAKGDDGKIAANQVDLDSDEIQQLLESGRLATELAVTINDNVSAVLTENLTLKSLRYGDKLIEQADAQDDGDDRIARLESDFFLMANALAEAIDSLAAMLGGISVREIASETGTRPDDSHPGEQVGGFEEEDSEYPRAILIAQQRENVTVTKLQRGLTIGYNRAQRLHEQLIRDGHIPNPYGQRGA
ncbi:recombination-associated protein RdgC (plasmid) [Halomonas qaidamensis]|uniref:Recombination-associated protein RdgC n=1 Tax=Halomonas qaidamensis TaxID=2866211 RepID=A0ABY6JUS6_9GAMM|nr:recombination-associated protein RdgC [Halomonas qaidamensis]UYV20945.1 recombination-associated protein RdgC [Halomonas qaidamensis]